MIEGLSDTNMMRIGIGLVALIVFLVILYSSRSKREQGRRVAAPTGVAAVPPVATDSSKLENVTFTGMLGLRTG